MNLDEAIRGRRSVRRFRSEPVADSLVLEILELARCAPSSMNGQPWEFVVVDDQKLLSQLRVIKDRFCPPEKRVYKATMFDTATIAIVVCANIEDSHDREIENAVLASAYIMLAAHTRGLASVYLSAQHAKQPALVQEIRDLLGIPQTSMPLTILPMGYPDESPETKPLKPLNVSRNRYGERDFDAAD